MGMIDPMVNMNNMGNNMGAPTGAMNIGSFNQGMFLCIIKWFSSLLEHIMYRKTCLAALWPMAVS